jgi:RNA 3'-terminal phosphate cyclase (ATP)
MTAVKAVAALSKAKVEGLHLGSTSIRFIPSELRGGRYVFDIGTAGSVTLVLQAILPVLAFVDGPVEITVRGGTDVPWSPPIDYVRFVLIELLRKFGLELEVELKRRGHYPRGGGVVVFRVRDPPRALKPVNLVERGSILSVEGLSHAVRLPPHVARRQANSAREVIEKELPSTPIHIDLEFYEPGRDPHLGPGSGIVLWARTEHSLLGGDSLGAKGKPAEQVGREAAMKLIEDLKTGMALDRHASDMLIPFAALARGTSRLGGARLTLHAITNIEVVKMVVEGVSVKVKGKEDEPFVAEIDGIGLTL